jgi:hypothetical protein
MKKKVFAISGILALAAAGIGFAQSDDGTSSSVAGGTLEIKADIKTGLQIKSTGEKDDRGNGEALTTIEAFNDDDDYPIRVNLGASWENDRGGLSFQFRYQPNEELDISGQPVDASSLVYASYAYGWVNLFNKKATVYGGKIDGGLWRDTGDIIDASADDVDGVRLVIKPVEAFSFGVALPYTLDGSTKNIKEAFKDIIIGIGYTGSDDFFIQTVVDLVPATDETSAGAGDGTESAIVIAGGAKVPLSKTALSIDWVYRSKAVTNNNDTNDFAGSPGLDLGLRETIPLSEKLKVYGQLRFGIPTGDGWSGDDANGDGPFGQLDQTGTETQLAFGFRVHGDYKVSDLVTLFGRIFSDNVAYLKGNGIGVRFGTSLAFSENTKIDIYDQIGRIGSDEDVSGGIVNLIRVNFNWSY